MLTQILITGALGINTLKAPQNRVSMLSGIIAEETVSDEMEDTENLVNEENIQNEENSANQEIEENSIKTTNQSASKTVAPAPVKVATKDTTPAKNRETVASNNLTNVALIAGTEASTHKNNKQVTETASSKNKKSNTEFYKGLLLGVIIVLTTIAVLIVLATLIG